MTGPLAQQIARLHTYIDTDGLVVMTEDARAALSVIERHVQDMETALLAVFVDPLGSHGARALARETLGIPFIPFATPEEMLAALPDREKGTE